MFLSTYEPLLCFFQVCCSVAEIITKSVQFVPTVSWGCRYPPYNTVSCGDLKCHCSGIAFTERTPSCNWAFYNQFQVGRERVEYDVPLFHQSCSLYGKSSSWGEKSDVSTTRNVYEKKCSLNMNRLVNIGQWCFYLTHCIIHVLFESLWASMKINKFLKAILARYLKNNIVAWSIEPSHRNWFMCDMIYFILILIKSDFMMLCCRYSHKEEVQVRLLFLTCVFSSIVSPDGFRKYMYTNTPKIIHSYILCINQKLYRLDF